jgi:hypothetical protein
LLRRAGSNIGNEHAHFAVVFGNNLATGFREVRDLSAGCAWGNISVSHVDIPFWRAGVRNVERSARV